MKVCINTRTVEQLRLIQEQEILDGKTHEEVTKPVVNIDGTLFIPGEWVHVEDSFVIDDKLYPFIKEVGVVLQEKIAQALEEKGLEAFAKGVKHARELHEKTVDEAVADVFKYVPEK